MEPRAPRLGREEAREEEEEPSAAAEADAAAHERPRGARLAAVERQEEERRHTHRQVGALERPGAHLAALVRDAHRPRAAPLARQQELRREGEATRLVASQGGKKGAPTAVPALRAVPPVKRGSCRGSVVPGSPSGDPATDDPGSP